MGQYYAGNLRQKAGRVMLGGLAVLALSVGPASADERPFRTLYGEGYEFLHKKGEAPVPVVPNHAVVRDGQAFRTLFGEAYGVVQQAGQPVGKTEPVMEAETTTEKSPFEELFREGYDFVAPRS
jgi:hypothetical protein